MAARSSRSESSRRSLLLFDSPGRYRRESSSIERYCANTVPFSRGAPAPRRIAERSFRGRNALSAQRNVPEPVSAFVTANGQVDRSRVRASWLASLLISHIPAVCAFVAPRRRGASKAGRLEGGAPRRPGARPSGASTAIIDRRRRSLALTDEGLVDRKDTVRTKYLPRAMAVPRDESQKQSFERDMR